MFAYHSQLGANRVLNIIDTESRGAARGIELRVLEFKWRFLGLDAEALSAAVDVLIREGLLRIAGGMLRLTRTGYASLTAANVGTAAPLPTGGPTQGTGIPTEYGVRGKLLGVFRSHELGAGGKLSAGELSRYWEVAGFRSADLRNGLDLLMRDGHSKMGRFSKTVFRLEKDGDQYVRGSNAPEWLTKEAIALEAENLRKQGIPDRMLCILAAKQFFESSGRTRNRAWSEVDYLLERYELPEFARFHAYELLHRLGYAEAAGGNELRLTSAGIRLVQSAESGIAEWAIQQAMKAASSDTSSALPRAVG